MQSLIALSQRQTPSNSLAVDSVNRVFNNVVIWLSKITASFVLLNIINSFISCPNFSSPNKTIASSGLNR